MILIQFNKLSDNKKTGIPYISRLFQSFLYVITNTTEVYRYNVFMRLSRFIELKCELHIKEY